MLEGSCCYILTESVVVTLLYLFQGMPPNVRYSSPFDDKYNSDDSSGDRKKKKHKLNSPKPYSPKAML